MNAINSWMRGCIPQRGTLVGAGKACTLLALTVVGARSIPSLKRNIPEIGLGLLLTGVGVGLIRGALSRKNRDALEMPLNRWAGADAGRQEAARRMLNCYDSQSLILNLIDLRLTELPPGIELLTKLNRLALSGNQLTALPESIGRLTNLTCLDLSDNQLTALPESIGDLTKLISLELRDNQLTALPESIGDLTKL
ncbi:MAG: leucine-rich repeat domain-containing protein, partial [Chlamydiia bacterium]